MGWRDNYNARRNKSGIRRRGRGPIDNDEAILRWMVSLCKLTENDCWEWGGSKCKAGYGVIFYKGRQWRATRLMLRCVGRELADELHACHSCDNPSCVNPAHLFAGNDAANQMDKRLKGRIRTGNNLSKEIYERILSFKGKLGPTKVARQLGVSYDTVAATWKRPNFLMNCQGNPLTA